MSGKSEKIKVLFAAFEAAPFIKTGGLGDVAGALPKALIKGGVDTRVVLPLLSQVPDEYRSRMRYVKHFYVILGWRRKYCGLFTMRKGGVTYYFLDNEYYFKREKIYGEYDDGERVAFFSKAVLELIKHIAKNFRPDIIHANDWHTALTPVFLKDMYMGDPLYDRIRTVFTIHNLRFQGQYSRFMTGDVLGLDGTPAEGQLIHDDSVNFLQGAVIYADKVTTVSPTYAREICTEIYGEGLEGLFESRKYKLSGIINGIDTKEYDPLTDKALTSNYGIKKIQESAIDEKMRSLMLSEISAAKQSNKIALQRELGLREDPDVPMFCMVSRLTEQKGADILSRFLHETLDRNMQVAVLGTGDKVYEDAIRSFADANSDVAAARITFDENLARRFYAGSDVFLMPSGFEPCGLSQMIAMRYASLPLVRETGGLKDTVSGYWDAGEHANGFSFRDLNVTGLTNTVDLALHLYYDEPEIWRRLMWNTISEDHSWRVPAGEYRTLYEELL